MRKWIAVSVLVLVCVFVSACAPSVKQSPDDLKALVNSLGDQAEKAFLSGDVDVMLQFYTDDIISMPDGFPMVRGKADLRRMTKAIFSSGLKFKSLESTTTDVQCGGDYVYEVGTYRQAVVMPGESEATQSEGKYVTIWKKQPDGQLKIAVEIYNNNSSD
jgi:ketosteroid isomerase-like protein